MRVATRALPDKLPVPPKIVSKIIEVAADPECTTIDLAKLISRDPTLTTQVLRAVNAAYYGLRRSIETVPHATAFMGISAVRNLVLSIGVQQLSSNLADTSFPTQRFWEASVQRGAAASCLARRLGAGEPDDFFTIGLCQDIGVLANISTRPELGEIYTELLDLSAGERVEREIELNAHHALIGAELLSRWQLPRLMTEIIQYHHTPDEAPPLIRTQCLIAVAAEAVCDLLSSSQKAEALERVAESLADLELSPSLMREIVDEVIDVAGEAAAMLQMRMGVQRTFEEIAELATDALVMLSVERPTAPGEVERALYDQQSRTANLEQRNEELVRLAATDPLTGLSNRRLLDDALEREFSRASRHGTVLSLLMIDIDHFKQINDRHGHSAGDAVLQAVSAVLRRSTRRMDTCARFGGEEFAVILPCTGEEPARIVADRIRSRIEEETVIWEGRTIEVTVSVGGMTAAGSSAEQVAEMAVRAADQALYNAKESGRNRVCWHEPD